MKDPHFWEDKAKAQALTKELNQLKSEGSDPYKDSGVVITIIAGAGGVDAEDFANMLFEMYKKYLNKNNLDIVILSENRNEHDGIRNISFEVNHKGTYSKLKNERGVHRLVRISPFNAKKQRHTSFALVDVIPKIPKVNSFELDEKDLEISLSRSSGPGGQNVNKRETAVRIKHIPTNITVRVETERSQLQNKEKALEILCGKLLVLMKKQRKEKVQDLKVDDSIEWSNQIRSYVIHPYKMVKDLRVNYEEKDPDKVFNGDIEGFIEALKNYSE